jgi:tetratricopeptide (TPR) repeat protein
MREELALVRHQQETTTVGLEKGRLVIIPKTNQWKPYLLEALNLLESTLMVGSIIIGNKQVPNQRAGLVKAKALLANALEHSPFPWVVLEVLALVTYYLGDPIKAKELAFNSLNQYEKIPKKEESLNDNDAKLNGYAFLTVGFCMQQQGALPLALNWYTKVSNWHRFSLLLRLDALWQVEACVAAFKKTTLKKSSKSKHSQLVTNRYQQYITYFSLTEQLQIINYCFKVFGLGFSLVKETTKKQATSTAFGAASTGQFTIPKACILEAQDCFSKGGNLWKPGVRILKRSLRKTPNEPAVWYELGLFYVQANHKTKAIAAFQECVNLSPTCSKAHLELGHLYHDLAQYIASAEAYVWAFSTTKDAFVKRQASYALSVIIERHAEKPSIQHSMPAISVVLALLLKQEQEAEFSTSGTPSHIAKLCQRLGWSELAYWYCLQSLSAMEVQPSQCVVNIAYMAAENGYLQEAVYYYKQSIMLDTCDASLHNSLGELYFEDLLLVDSARQEFEQAIALDPTSTTAHFNLGQVYGLQQQWTLAAHAFAKARDLNEVSKELDRADLDHRLHQLYENL